MNGGCLICGENGHGKKNIEAGPCETGVHLLPRETKAKLAGTGLEEELTVISGPEDAERLDLESRYAVFIDIPQSLDIFDHVINGKKLERIYLIFYQSDEHFSQHSQQGNILNGTMLSS